MQELSPIIQEIFDVFSKRGNERYADEEVTQLEHALQTAALARQVGAPTPTVAASLLHDIGHILSEKQLPAHLEEDLHDHHEERGYHWLLDNFGAEVAEPVKLHVAAKRYLCTTQPEYLQKLSPTSLKSYHDQGGKMSAAALAEFEANPFFQEAVKLRQWDDKAKIADWEVPDIESYIPTLQAVLKT